jgi:hypothetical protein
LNSSNYNGSYAIPGENDFLTVYPESKDFWDYDKNSSLNPTKLLPNSNKKAYFKCKECDHIFSKSIYHFIKKPKCPYCNK